MAFQRHQVNGVEVFLPHGLLLAAPALTIDLGGFWRLRWLRVHGAAMPQGCAM